MAFPSPRLEAHYSQMVFTKLVVLAFKKILFYNAKQLITDVESPRPKQLYRPAHGEDKRYFTRTEDNLSLKCFILAHVKKNFAAF